LGRKVHPLGFRLGVIKTWTSRWYAEGADYVARIAEDKRIRDMIRRDMGQAGIAEIEIERLPNQVIVIIHTAKPGIIIGRRGASVKQLRQDLEDGTGKRIKVEVQEVDRPDLSAYLVAENIASQLERRISHGRAMRRAVQQAMRAGAEGVMIACVGLRWPVARP
jgi:small subunit ribosomal protein S3